MGNLKPNLVFASPVSGIGPLSARKLELSDLPSGLGTSYIPNIVSFTDLGTVTSGYAA